MATDLESLLELFKAELPGESAHLEMYPARAKSSEALKTAGTVRMSAVAIVLFEKDNGLETILIRRQEYDGVHSGQISFPGGKWEEQDKNLEETAKRECREEIGINPDELDLVGKLTNVFVPVSNFLIEPYVFYWGSANLDFYPAEREVASVHRLPLKLLTDESIELIDILMASGLKLPQIPHFNTGEIAIWGATALILNELRKLLQTLL